MYLKIGMEIHVCLQDILGLELHVMKDQEYVSSLCKLNSFCFHLYIVILPLCSDIIGLIYTGTCLVWASLDLFHLKLRT